MEMIHGVALTFRVKVRSGPFGGVGCVRSIEKWAFFYCPTYQSFIMA